MYLKRLLHLVIILGLLPVTTFSRAIVFPQESAVKSWEKYVLRVPNERGVPTTGVELTFPAELKVMSFQDVPGWKLTIHKDSAGLPIAAEWRGTLAVDRFVEFPFVAINPDNPSVLNWPTTQEYAGGELVHWTGADTSETPVSSTKIVVTAAIQSDTVTTTNLKPSEERYDSCNFYSCYVPWAALVVALIALIIALIKRKQKPL